ncbi:hypothetical protein FHY03_004062 [Sphingomonas sp. BK345]|nr:hypothetical protein [Sphingomonas sp. BK345]
MVIWLVLSMELGPLLALLMWLHDSTGDEAVWPWIAACAAFPCVDWLAVASCAHR